MDNDVRIRLGIIGTGRIAKKFISELTSIPAFELVGVYNPNTASAMRFCEGAASLRVFKSLAELCESIDAVYIASPHPTHYEYCRFSLEEGLHVLCEKPMAVSANEVVELYDLAKERDLVLLEGIKTAFYPAFIKLEQVIKSEKIGEVVDVEASFTKLVSPDSPELSSREGAGSVFWLASYPLYAIGRLLGKNYREASFYSLRDDQGVDLFTRGLIAYEGKSASFKVGLGAKTDGCLVVTGTEGFAVVPAPWWNTSSFWLGFEDPKQIEEYCADYEGSGLRYEIAEFARLIQRDETESERLAQGDSQYIAGIMEQFLA